MYRIGLCCRTILGLTGCDIDPLCSSQVLQIARDTGSDRYAATVLRDCGATTDYATVVQVGRAGELQSAARDVFVADSGAASSFAGNAIWTSVVWTRPGQLSVAYATKARVFRREPTAKGAVIRYFESDPIGVPPPG
ncbi:MULTISPECIES: hypothetical protein [unclassified Sphingomonas]|uniref:hypothetical protein n=1 Tax=unclassified Sphingomonas TaxID=196159 RepID=UPI0012E183EB|nr:MULTISPECIES: hypothetical protein [unclassified Sphingomonas]